MKTIFPWKGGFNFNIFLKKPSIIECIQFTLFEFALHETVCNGADPCMQLAVFTPEQI